MKPIIEPDEPSGTTAPPSPGSSSVVGKLLAALALIVVAILGYGSTSGWFGSPPSDRDAAEVKTSNKEAPALPTDISSSNAANPSTTSGTEATTLPPTNATIIPPLDAIQPDDSKKLLDEGKRVAEHLVRSLANSIEAKEVQARFEYEFGETTKAEQLWQEIIAVNPNYVYALKGLGDVANLNGKLEESVGYYRRGVLADPNDLTLQVLLGVSLLNASQFNEAKQTLESVLARDPSRSDAHVELASVLSQLQDYQGAKDHLEIALKDHPELPEIHFGLANAYTRLGDREKAKHHQTEHLRLRKNSVEAREQGRRTYDDLAALNIDIGNLYVLMARTYLAGGYRDAASLLLLRASRMNPQDPECRRALAFLALGQGKTFDAVRWLTEVLEITPDDYSVVKEIGRLHVQNRQPKLAEKAMLDFFQTHPKFAEVAKELARFYIQVDRNEEKAIQYGKTSCELAPTADNMAMLASIYDTFDRLNEAIEAMAKAVELQPTNASYQQAVALLKETAAKKNKDTQESKP